MFKVLISDAALLASTCHPFLSHLNGFFLLAPCVLFLKLMFRVQISAAHTAATRAPMRHPLFPQYSESDSHHFLLLPLRHAFLSHLKECLPSRAKDPKFPGLALVSHIGGSRARVLKPTSHIDSSKVQQHVSPFFAPYRP